MLKRIAILIIIVVNSMVLVACSNARSSANIKTIKKADILQFDIEKLSEEEVLKTIQEHDLKHKPTHIIKITNNSKYRIFRGTLESNFINDNRLHEKIFIRYGSLEPNQSIYLMAESTVDDFEITSYSYRTEDVSMNVYLDQGKINKVEDETYSTSDYKDKDKIEIEIINKDENSDIDWNLYDTPYVARIKNLTDRQQWIDYNINLYNKNGEIITDKEMTVNIGAGEELYMELNFNSYKEMFVGEVVDYELVNYNYKDTIDDTGQEYLIIVGLIDEIYEMYEN